MVLGHGNIFASFIAPPPKSDSNSLPSRTYDIEVTSTAFMALFVHVEVSGMVGTFSENLFHMLPNSTKVITFRPKSNRSFASNKVALSVHWLQEMEYLELKLVE